MDHKGLKEIDEKQVREEAYVTSSQDAESLPAGEGGLTRQLKNRHIAMIRY
jgi:amino acid permease